MPTLEEINQKVEALATGIRENAATRADREKRGDERAQETNVKLDKLSADYDALRAVADDLGKKLDDANDRLERAEQAASTRGGKGSTAEDEEKEGQQAYGRSFIKQLSRSLRGQGATAEDEELIKREEQRYFDMFGGMGDEPDRRNFSVGDFSQAGVLVPAVMASSILERVLPISPVRAEANVVGLIKGTEYKIPAEDNMPEFEVGWVGEGVSRPVTGHPSLKEISIVAHEMYAQPAATQLMLDVASFNFMDWLMRRLTTSFAKKEGEAFLKGDGSHKPLGLLDSTSGIARVKSGNATGITYAGLVNIQEELYALYRQNAKWFTGRSGIAAFRKLVDDENRPLWNVDVRNGAPEQLLGKPIVLFEDMPNVGAGALAYMYGDLRAAYTIVDGLGMRVTPDNLTTKPFVLMYTVRRVGGRTVLPEALRILEIGT